MRIQTPGCRKAPLGHLRSIRGMIERSPMLHARMDNDLKQKATEALAAMELSASEAVRLLFHCIVVDRAFPLELKVPNAGTRAAMVEAEEILKSGKPRFATADEMFAELEKTGREQTNQPAAPGRFHRVLRQGLGTAVAIRALRHERAWKSVMLLPTGNGAPLGPERRDHALKGEWSKRRLCHVGGDFLLTCRLDETAGPGGTVVFVRAGTHSELFQ